MEARMEKHELTDRTRYFDYLRVFATFAVVIIHVAAQNWYTTDVNGFDWKVFNFYNSIARWAVPVFVMISGALFLPRKIDLKTMLTKYAFRLATAFIAWSIIYAIFSRWEMESRLGIIVYGYYHMWFVLMMIGIYICMPFIKQLVEKDFLIKYYLLLSFIFAFFVPQIIMVS